MEYLARQLEELSYTLSQVFKKPFKLESLKEAIRIENETRRQLVKFFHLLQEHFYPGELISQLYLMMGTHLLMGTQEFLDLVRFMNEDILTYPAFEGKRILWVHLLPFYQESLRQYFNGSSQYQIFGSDIILDSWEDLDETQPFRSLAKKLIRNIYNGSYSHKADMLSDLADRLKPDAVIHFCHWG